MMKKFLLGSVGLAAMLAGPAMAADMRVAPPPPPVAYYDWTGAYIGFNAGATWYDVNRHFTGVGGGFLPSADVGTNDSDGILSSASTLARSGSGALGSWVPRRR